mmetsp:Transcript_42869/g.84040  ORF Transcript_42869/g.84040 Transcript_42869/m.84040 type:complete len:169 (+) Transcript_42869:44-550(+)
MPEFPYSAQGHRDRGDPFDAPTWGYCYSDATVKAEVPVVPNKYGGVGYETHPQYLPPNADAPVTVANPYEKIPAESSMPYTNVSAKPIGTRYAPAVTGSRLHNGFDTRTPGSLPFVGGAWHDRYPGEYQEQASQAVKEAYDESRTRNPDRPDSFSNVRSAYNRPSSLF